MLLALLATLSRSGMMSMVIAAAAAAALAPGSRRRRALLLVGGLAVLLVGAATLDSDGLAARVDDTLRPGGPITRVAIWAETLRLGEAFPLAGTGAGTFADAMLQYQRRATEVLFNHAHNEPLQLLAEGGLLLVVPLAVLMAIGAATIRRRLAADPHPGDVIRIGAVAGLCAVAAQSIWETGLRTPSNLLLAALLAAIALRPARPAAAPDDRQ
jgi:O-antigen ligase